MIRIATVGTSDICQCFLDGMKLTNQFVLSAVYSRSLKTGTEFAKKNGCNKVFCDIEEMAQSGEIDAVYIASPNSCHFSQSKIFLQNGIHVLCEKPIVTAENEYETLLNLANGKGLIYAEAIMPRHTAQYGAVKNAMESIGKIQAAYISFLKRSSRLDAFLSGKPQNIFDMSLKAGCLMDIGVYCVYAAVDLLGEPQSVKADCSYLYNGADGSGSAILKYDGFTADLTYSKTCDSILASEIIGENGSLKIGKISQYCDVSLVCGGKEQKIFGTVSKAEIMSGEAKRFADYILRFESNKQDYINVCNLTRSVHKTMDLIKKSSGIIYPEE